MILQGENSVIINFLLHNKANLCHHIVIYFVVSTMKRCTYISELSLDLYLDLLQPAEYIGVQRTAP